MVNGLKTLGSRSVEITEDFFSNNDLFAIRAASTFARDSNISNSASTFYKYEIWFVKINFFFSLEKF